MQSYFIRNYFLIMRKQLQKNLIATIREHIPKNANITNYLADTLILGRESVYRRLRGEINFTFEEVSILSSKLGFSIDNLVGMRKNENALFSIPILQDAEYLEIYRQKMLEYGKLFCTMGNFHNAEARLAINMLPYFLHIEHENLSRFRLFKWLYQNQKIEVNSKFADFLLPENILAAHRTFQQDLIHVPNATMIMDNNVFWSVAKDIEYFQKRGLLSTEDVMRLKEELYRIIDDLEMMAINGVCKNGIKISIYTSAVDLEATYLHFEQGDSQFSQVRIFAISAIDSYDKRLCEVQKKWIESLKRYSTLITQSGEMQRFEYLNGQRDIINSILKIES